MRHKSRTITAQLPPCEEIISDPNTGAVSFHFTMGPLTYGRIVEHMLDVGGKARGMKPCKHTKTTREILIMSDNILSPNTGLLHRSSNGYRPRQVDSQGISASGFDEVNVSGPFETFLMEAGQYMRPSFNDGSLSLINSLIELKDLVRLRDLLRHGPPHRRRRSRRNQNTYQEWLRYAANWHLTWIFGLAPFLRDLGNILDAIKRVRDSIKGFLDEEGQIKYKRYYRELKLDYSENNSFVGGPYGWRYLIEGSFTRPPMAHTTLRYSYDIPKLGDVVDHLSAYLDAFGVGLDPAIIWNAIPYSFIIDWFVNVGGYLHSLRIDNLPIHLIIHGSCASYDYEYSTMVSVDATGGSSSFMPCIHTVGSVYNRTVLQEYPAMLPRWGSPGWGQGLIGLSLIVAHKKSPRRRPSGLQPPYRRRH